MTRGLLASLGLHVGILAAALLGPRAEPFRWDPDKPLAVELVASAAELPVSRSPAKRPAPQPKPLEAPAKQPVGEIVEEKPPPVEAKTPRSVRPQPAVQRPPRQFKRVAPKRTDEGPSLEERLQQGLQHVEEQESPVPPPTASESLDSLPGAGSAPSAEVEAPDFPFAWYLRQVQTRVRDSWDTPGDRLLAGRSNPVGVALVIHRDGHVSDVRIEVPSGTPGLDASALRAVQRAQPFPPLPDPYEAEALALTIRFRLAGAGP